MKLLELTVGVVVAVPDDAHSSQVEVELPLDLLTVFTPTASGDRFGTPLAYYSLDFKELRDDDPPATTPEDDFTEAADDEDGEPAVGPDDTGSNRLG